MLEEYFSVRSNITRIFVMLKLLTSFRPVEFYAELVKTTGDCDLVLRFNPRTNFSVYIFGKLSALVRFLWLLLFERTIDCVFFVTLFSQCNASLRQAIAFLCLILGKLEKTPGMKGAKKRVRGEE